VFDKTRGLLEICLIGLTIDTTQSYSVGYGGARVKLWMRSSIW